jgi:hypothetical protein
MRVSLAAIVDPAVQPRPSEATERLDAYEREHTVAQKANAAEREHYAHRKLNQWVNPLSD